MRTNTTATAMTAGKAKAPLFAVLLAMLVAGCGGRSAVPRPDTSGLAALDAQATLAVWAAQETAVAAAAQAAVSGTRAATEATAAASDALAASSAATAAAGQAAATAQSGAVTATADALAARAMELGIAATATADAAALAFQEAQAAKALAARQAEIDRQAMWTGLLPWLVGAAAAVVGGTLVILVVAWALPRILRARPQRAGDTWIMVDARGVPTVLNRPPRALPPGEPVRQLPARTEAHAPGAAVPLPAMRTGHVLIAGETRSGKSTAMRAVLAPRGPRVVVLDPHYTDQEGWGAAQVIGAGRDYEAIREYMGEMNRMLRERYEARAAGQARFDPLTVAVDEMPSIVDAVGREIAVTWRQWLREGRKVGLFLVLSTQSTRVRTLGIEGEKDLLENFTCVLALGALARREYGAVVEGLARPAAIVLDGRARPVVIPEVTARPSPRAEFVAAGDLDGGDIPDADAILLPSPAVNGNGHGRALYVAPVPTAEPDPDNMTEADRRRIVAAFRATRSMAAVQREVFPSYRGSGGRAFYAIKDTLIAAGELPPYREGGAAASGYAPAPGAW